MEIVKSIKKKHNLWKKYMNTKQGEEYQKYRKARNKVKGEIGKLRRKQELQIAKYIKNNPKRFWRFINEKSKIKSGVGDLHTDPKDTTSPITNEDRKKVNILGDLFSSVFTNEPPGDIPEISRSPSQVSCHYVYLSGFAFS